MKSAKDPRHQKRIAIVKTLFVNTFDEMQTSEEVIEILAKKDEIDEKVAKAAPTWPISKINKIDLAILRLAVFEIYYKQTPPKVAIDEAVEIAKRYGSESSASFVNGVLGAIVNSKTFSPEAKGV